MFEKLRTYLQKQPKIGSEYNERLEKLEGIIGTKIDNPFLFVRALRHRSSLVDDDFASTDSYERLEFLGDAVLDLIVSEIIFDRFPNEDEGFLTKLRSKLVKGDALASYAEKLQLSEVILIGERAKGQGIEFSKSALSDVFESLVGAIYIDRGYKDAAEFVDRVIDKHVDFDDVIATLDNYKSLLLEYAQAHELEIPRYEVMNEYGPGHDKTFEVKAIVDDKAMGQGKGKSKKEAEQKAARRALQSLKGRR
ncbi:MAG: ribonuclease III [Balneolaceae bacterium]|nr:ribonuclease III [Balneolaceae bacterium]